MHFGFGFTFLPRLGSKTPICSSGAWLEEEMFCTAPAWALPNWAGWKHSSVLGCGVMSRSLDKELGVL